MPFNIFKNSKFVRFLMLFYIILVFAYLFGKDIAPGFFDALNISMDTGLFGTKFALKHIIFLSGLPVIWRLYKDELL